MLRGQKWVFDPLELELQVIVSYPGVSLRETSFALSDKIFSWRKKQYLLVSKGWRNFASRSSASILSPSTATGGSSSGSNTVPCMCWV